LKSATDSGAKQSNARKAPQREVCSGDLSIQPVDEHIQLTGRKESVMAESQNNKQPYPFLNKLNLVVTIFVALLGGFISVMQLRMSNEQQKLSNLVERRQFELESRIDITDQSAELLRKAKEYLDILNLEEDKKKLVLISLLQLEKELRTSKTGELDAEQRMMDKVNALPYNMALLAGASEALAHIGGTENDLKLWLPIA